VGRWKGSGDGSGENFIDRDDLEGKMGWVGTGEGAGEVVWCEVNGSMTLWGIGMKIFAMPRTDSCGGGDARETMEGVFVGSGRVKI
jgi:hypothetical protein